MDSLFQKSQIFLHALPLQDRRPVPAENTLDPLGFHIFPLLPFQSLPNNV